MALLTSTRWRSDTETKERWAVDQSAIMAFYAERLFDDTDPEQVAFREVLSRLSAAQRAYNAAHPPCRGLSFMKLNTVGRNYCNQPFCPSCWHRRQQDLLSWLADLPDGTTYYLRTTDTVNWSEPIHPRVVQRFKANGARFALRAYTALFESDGAWPDPELEYGLMGIFTHQSGPDFFEPVSTVLTNHHDPHSTAAGQIRNSVHRDTADLRTAWLNTLHHPWEFVSHGLFHEYANHFATERPLGRSWTRINRKVKHGQKACKKEAGAEAGRQAQGGRPDAVRRGRPTDGADDQGRSRTACG